MAAYYNEIEPAAAHVIECLIKEGVIADGVVDRRSISDVDPVDVKDFTQCHFFAGGGLWSVALRLAGWPDARSIWTGSCPCQPFSAAGKRAGKNDKRHLWPDFFRLIRACRPSVVMGEQVAGAAGYDWFDGVASDLEGVGYAARAVDIPALAVGASHIRQRLYWVSVEKSECERERRRRIFRSSEGISKIEIRPSNKFGGRSVDSGDMGDTVSARLEGQPWDVPGRDKSGRVGTVEGGSIAASGDRRDMANTDDAIGRANISGRDDANRDSARREEATSYYGSGGAWDDAEWVTGVDGKARRVKPGVRLLADGIPGRIHLLRLGGNAIVPPLAAEVIKAMMESDEIFFVEHDC